MAKKNLIGRGLQKREKDPVFTFSVSPDGTIDMTGVRDAIKFAQEKDKQRVWVHDFSNFIDGEEQKIRNVLHNCGFQRDIPANDLPIKPPGEVVWYLKSLLLTLEEIRREIATEKRISNLMGLTFEFGGLRKAYMVDWIHRSSERLIEEARAKGADRGNHTKRQNKEAWQRRAAQMLKTGKYDLYSSFCTRIALAMLDDWPNDTPKPGHDPLRRYLRALVER